MTVISTQRIRTRTTVLLAGLLWLLGCATRDGENPYALWERYEDPNGRFVVRYLAPPWEVVSLDDADRILLAASPAEDAGVAMTVHDTPLGARYLAVVESLPEKSAALYMEVLREEWAQQRGYILQESEEYSGRGEALGWRLDGEGSGRRLFVLIYDLPGGGVVVLKVAAPDVVEMADLELMLAGFEPLVEEAR